MYGRDKELRRILAEDYAFAKECFETTEEGNWEHENNILKRNLDSGQQIKKCWKELRVSTSIWCEANEFLQD